MGGSSSGSSKGQRGINTDGFEVLNRLANSPLAVIEWDSQFRVIGWSDRAQEIFGWTAAEVMGRHPSEWKFIYDKDLKNVDSVISELQAGRWRSEIVHNRNVTKDGRVLCCAWYNSVQFDDRGRLASVFSLVIDETESKRVENELRVQQRRLQYALESSEIGGWDWAIKEGHVSWFGSMSKIFEIPGNEFAGDLATSYRSVHPDDTDNLRVQVEKAVETCGEFSAEFRVILASGAQKWIHGRGRVYADSDGTPERLIGTCTDITSRKNEEAGLKTAKSQAEVTSAQKSAFLANMSHEIRTPLGVILGFAELLSDPDLDPRERADYMTIISRNGEHLSRLINDILDLSKVEAGKIEIYRKEFSLRCVLSDVVESLKSKAEEKGVEITWSCEERLPLKVCADPLRIKQILINLAGNALKFTPSGKIEIRAVADSEKKNMLRISIIDTGVGISKSSQAKLFQSFYQGDHQESQAFGGTGLGLTLSRKIARLLGGDIVLQRSEVGLGSVFEFTFPFESPFIAENKSEGDYSEYDDHPLEGIKLLLAEDAVDVQVLMERILKRRGASIEIAKDGEEALMRAEHGNFDVVLMDIQMPGIDGYEATRRLRRKGYDKPIIALTAHAMIEEKKRSFEAGCDDHLAKPVNPAALVQSILDHTKSFHHH